MGRTAGWLAGAAVLAKRSPADAPHIVLLPEIPFNEDAFLSKVDASLDFLDFMSKAETDLAFGKFFFSEMFKCYEKSIAQKLKPQFSSPK